MSIHLLVFVCILDAGALTFHSGSLLSIELVPQSFSSVKSDTTLAPKSSKSSTQPVVTTPVPGALHMLSTPQVTTPATWAHPSLNKS